MDGVSATWSRVRCGTTPRDVEVRTLGDSISSDCEDALERLMRPIFGANRVCTLRAVENLRRGIDMSMVVVRV